MGDLTGYRNRVIKAVECPVCAQPAGEQCVHAVHRTLVRYVHDDRSFAYETAQEITDQGDT